MKPSDSFAVVIVNAGTSDPSSTALLADRIATLTADKLGTQNTHVRTLNLKTLAVDIAHALTTNLMSEALEDASNILGAADAIIASTPVYKASASALFSGFFQVLDNDLLIGKPVALAATAGSARHSLVIDHEMRTLFAYLRTLVTPTGIFATPEDWSTKELGDRIDRAATELALLARSNFASDVRRDIWNNYQHSYGSAGGTELEINLNSDLMRLATGG